MIYIPLQILPRAMVGSTPSVQLTFIDALVPRWSSRMHRQDDVNHRNESCPWVRHHEITPSWKVFVADWHDVFSAERWLPTSSLNLHMKAKCLNPRRQSRWVGFSRSILLPGKRTDGLLEPKDNMPLRVRKVTRSTWWLSRSPDYSKCQFYFEMRLSLTGTCCQCKHLSVLALRVSLFPLLNIHHPSKMEGWIRNVMCRLTKICKANNPNIESQIIQVTLYW